MQEVTFMDRYPVFTKTIEKDKTRFNNIDEIISYLRDKIEKDPIAIYIGIFDHYAYTKGLESHEISKDIRDAKNIMCCFGDKLILPQIAGIRPRSFGIVVTDNAYVISFLQAPSPVANSKMIQWVEEIED